MGFDDFFEQGHKHQKYRNDHHHRNDDYYRSSHSTREHFDMKTMLLNKLQSNPKLRLLLIVGALLAVVVFIVIIILLLPLLQKLIGFVTENGLQGIIDTLWKGTKE